jgi:DNA replication and repair protein RecF
MQLTHLSLTNFRNFTRLDMDIPTGPVLLIGDNAQGKTSLLEAVYFLATLASFHAYSDRQLINFLASRDPLAVARIVADYRRAEASHRLEIRIIQEANINCLPLLRKEMLFDGVKRKAFDVIGQFNAVLFLPQMLHVIEGAPDERRRYINQVLAQVIGYYPEALSEYNHALTQRNALLKQIQERSGDEAQLDFWDEKLASAGAQLIHARIHAVQELERSATRIHHELTHGSEVLRVCYQPAYDPSPQPTGQYALPMDAPVDRSGISLAQIRQGFLSSLVHLRNEEVARGVTTIGPHRDELRFMANGIDLGIYGSRGQVRTAMLSLKLAEVAWMKAKTGQWPVLLLDEVLAELDMQHRVDLLNRLTESEQALLTTTDLDLFSPDFVHKAALWKVQGGRIFDERNSQSANQREPQIP